MFSEMMRMKQNGKIPSPKPVHFNLQEINKEYHYIFSSFIVHIRYFTDILNMLQGVYIFMIFVCKRNVYEVIFGEKGKTREGLEMRASANATRYTNKHD